MIVAQRRGAGGGGGGGGGGGSSGTEGIVGSSGSSAFSVMSAVLTVSTGPLGEAAYTMSGLYTQYGGGPERYGLGRMLYRKSGAGSWTARPEVIGSVVGGMEADDGGVYEAYTLTGLDASSNYEFYFEGRQSVNSGSYGLSWGGSFTVTGS